MTKKKNQNHLIRFSGLLFLFREIIQRKYVTIVFLHNWSVKTGAMAFKYLYKNYNVISLDKYIEYLENPNKVKIPPKSVIITIDDGFKENYKLLPLIKKYNLPVTIFLTSGIINTNKQFWFKFNHPDLSKENLKNISNKERISLLNGLGFDYQKEYELPIALNKDQILDMKGDVNFQSHTMSHPILPSCNDDEADFEIGESKKVLEEEYGLNINSFAFPNGDYSVRDLELVKSHGYKCSLITEPGFNTKKSDIFRLKRISVRENPSKSEFAVLVSGIRIYAFNFKTLFNKNKRKNNLKSSSQLSS